MQIGTARLTFHLPYNNSLKGKRQLSQSLISRLRQRFNVSVAEVDGQELWQLLVLGIASVSNQNSHANQVLDEVLAYVRGLQLDAELVGVERDILPGV